MFGLSTHGSRPLFLYRNGTLEKFKYLVDSSGGAHGASPPVAGDVVYIESNHAISVRSADEACSSITFTGDGAELEIQAKQDTDCFRIHHLK